MLVELTKEEFNSFASNHENSIFFQSSNWALLKESTGWISYYVGFKKDNIEAATLLLGKKIPVINKYIYYAPRGFLIDYKNYDLLKTFTEEIVKFIKSKKGIFVKINPLVMYQERDINGNIVDDGINNKDVVDNLKKLGYQHVGLTTDYGKDIEPRWISVLNLKDKTMEDVMSNYNSTTRWEVKDSYKHGLSLVEIDESRLKEFKDLMVHTGERRGFIDRPLSYYKKMYEEFSKDNSIKIMLVELNVKKNLETYENNKNNLLNKIEQEKNKPNVKENRIKELESQLEATERKIKNDQELLNNKGEKITVAAGLFMTYGRQVVSLFGASYKEYMKYKGQYFLNNEMIKYAIDNNYEKYNFYGITGHFEKGHPMYGLFDYKRGFGSDVVELIGEFTYVTNKFNYALYKIMKKGYSLIKKVRK